MSLARTLGVPAIFTSYAIWQSNREGHLGDLLSEMRRSMAEAVRLAPSIWFVDEINSMPNRSNDDLRYREWYVAVTNGLLEITERGARPGVIILGAANDITRMDPALMRAGRFGDRIIEIPRPDAAALCVILRHHLAGDLASVDLLPFARSALGATGADVAAWVRGARRLARNESRSLHPDDLMKQIVPEDDRSADDVRRAAYHEAGHCVASMVLTGRRPDFVMILQKGSSGGRTASPAMGTDFPTRQHFDDHITILLCGRAAEEVLIGSPSAACAVGPDSDLARATDLVVGMHTAWGLGQVPIVQARFRKASALLHADADLRRTVADHIAGIYDHALKLTSDNARAIHLIAEQLMVARHLDGHEIDRILKSAADPASGNVIAWGDSVPGQAGEASAARTDPGVSATGKQSNNRGKRFRRFDP